MGIDLSHFHVRVSDLDNAKKWFADIVHIAPSFEKSNFVYYKLNNLTVVLNKARIDTEITLAIKSNNCDDTCKTYIERGATLINGPKNQIWGVRSAYFKGPGKITLEIEQPMERKI